MTATRIPGPSHPPGPLASPVAASDIAGISLDAVHALIRDGSVRSERIKGSLFVDLDDIARAVARDASGDAGV